MPEWRNGRRARLKIVYRKVWRFESSLRHNLKYKRVVYLFYMENFSLAQNGISFLGFFIAGLAVNLTPCVYPMITVTVSLFKRKDSEQKEVIFFSFLKALFYVLGIAVTYSALGYFAATTGKLFGGILQSKCKDYNCQFLTTDIKKFEELLNN